MCGEVSFAGGGLCMQVGKDGDFERVRLESSWSSSEDDSSGVIPVGFPRALPLFQLGASDG